MPSEMHYGQYLQLDQILQAQSLESAKLNQPAHDEMLFIIIHQSYELWFKQLLFEVGSVNKILEKPAMNDNSPELQTIVHRLSRCVTILKLLVQQIEVMETMEPMDFLDFRDMLRPASGFQSWQFKVLEASLGLKYAQRHGQEYYISQLHPEEIARIRKAESSPSLLELINSWLERMPFFEEPLNWKHFRHTAQSTDLHPFWAEYQACYQRSLASPEINHFGMFEEVLIRKPQPRPEDPPRALSARACRSALFIMLYRGYPMLQLPFQLLNQALELDAELSTWRYRHMQMVQRTIGTRIGTGGSSGRDYLKSALDKHYIFKEIAQLSSFLIERKKLPPLSREMEARLGFIQG